MLKKNYSNKEHAVALGEIRSNKQRLECELFHGYDSELQVDLLQGGTLLGATSMAEKLHSCCHYQPHFAQLAPAL
jgi:hypothetical protein